MISQKFSFPKRARLVTRREFCCVKTKGHKSIGQFIILYTLNKEGKKLGLTVSRRFGKAHERNLFKRRCREAFRLIAPELPNRLHINVVPRARAKKTTVAALANELRTLILSDLQCK